MKNLTNGDSSHQTTSGRSRPISIGAAFFLAAAFGASSVYGAADGTWIGEGVDELEAPDPSWQNGDNWDTGALPEDFPAGVNTATFDNAGNGNTDVNIATDTQPILNLIIDTAEAASYTFSGGRFRVRANGTIQMTASVVAPQVFNNKISLGINDKPNNFNLLNQSTDPAAILTVNGDIQGDQAAGVTVGTKNLIVGGAGDIVLNGAIQNTAGTERQLGLTKVGTGTVTIDSSENIYTGFTRVTAGTLVVSANGFIETSGEVSVSAAGQLVLDPDNGHLVRIGNSLGGGGIVSNGPVFVEEGGGLVPGDAGVVGTLTVDSLTMDPGSTVEFEVAAGGASDLVEVTDTDELVLNGGVITLYEEGSTDPVTQTGTFDLFEFAGTLQGAGVSELSIANPASGFEYAFGVSGNTVQVTLTSNGAFWGVDADGSWTTAGNWSNATVPDGMNVPASFGGGAIEFTAGRAVTVDGDKTVGSITFEGEQSFTVTSGTPDPSTITFDSAPNAPLLKATSGSHTLGADLVVPVGFDLSVASGSTLDLSGDISGDGGLNLADGGDVILSGSNSYLGSTVVEGGTLNIQGDQSLANADVSVGVVGDPFAVLNVESGAVLSVDVGSNVAVGTPGAVGANGDTRAINVAGSVTNDGSLNVGRAGSLTLNSGGEWSQDGDLTLQVIGNIGNPNLTVEEGGLFTYTGVNTIKVNGPQPTAAPQVGDSVVTIQGDFVTAAGFEEGKIGIANPGTGRGEVIIDGGTLQLSADVPDLAFALVGELALILENEATIDTNSFSSTVSAEIEGAGSLTKAGEGTLTMTGLNSYTGETIVSGGVLSVNGTSLDDLSTLDIGSAVVELAADEVVSILEFDSVPQEVGIWGAPGSVDSDFTDARFSGAGLLIVTGGSPFQAWSDINTGGQGPEEDFDLDGMQNGIEFFLGAPAGFTMNPGVVDGSITWLNGGNIAPDQYGSQYVVQTSTDLLIWDDVDEADLEINDATTLSYLVPSGSDPLFIRLEVTPN